MSETNSLWLEKEPTAEEVITEFENIDINLYDEIIFVDLESQQKD